MTQHNFENDNKYHERSVQARKSTLVSVVVNIFLSALQVVVGIFSGSQGLIADGMHSFSDLVADGVVLVANKKSRRPSDHDHHYGHWRYENGASDPRRDPGAGRGRYAVVRGGSSRATADDSAGAQRGAVDGAGGAGRQGGAVSLYAGGRQAAEFVAAHRQRLACPLDAASSLVVALGIIGNLAGFAWFDPLAALAVGLLIARMGYRFAASALHDLMDRAVDEETQQAIADTLRPRRAWRVCTI
jgi:divalent metal cation (Fe/Co/Zn/Cd) transporter